MAESQANKSQTKRKVALKRERQEDYREKLSFVNTLRSINKAEDAMESMANDEIERDAERFGMLEKVAILKYRRLNKLLPDLKATESEVQVSGRLNLEVDWVGTLSEHTDS